jgi:hypothetical protein
MNLNRGGLHKEQAAATGYLGNCLRICLKIQEDKESLFQYGRSQDLPRSL